MSKDKHPSEVVAYLNLNSLKLMCQTCLDKIKNPRKSFLDNLVPLKEGEFKAGSTCSVCNKDLRLSRKEKKSASKGS